MKNASRNVGLLLVHGIGNQVPGALANKVATHLGSFASNDNCVASEVSDSSIPNDGSVLNQTIAVGNVHVVLREANWSSISNLDNRVQVRSIGYLLSNYLNHLDRRIRGLSVKFRKLQASGLDRAQLLGIIIAAVMITSLFNIYFKVFQTSEILKTQPPWIVAVAAAIAAVAITAMIITIIVRTFDRAKTIVERHRVRLKRASAVRRNLELGMWWLLASIGEYCIAAVAIIYGPILMILALLTLVAAFLLNWLAKLLAVIFNAVADGLASIHWKWACTWIRRICWIMIVMPVYGVLSVIKAEYNLVSVLFSDARTRYKAVAAFGTLSAYIGYLMVYVLVLEIPFILAIMPWVVPFLDGASQTAWIANIIIAIIFFGIGLAIIKVFLPAVDLLFDIAHYHLASSSHRSQYQSVLERGIQSLADSGCDEIHILAHSLGTVITVDLLQAGRCRQWPIRVLHTVGSPLDKFWYFDRTHRRHDNDVEIVEHPSLRWLNYWAPSDPISGKLSHFCPLDDVLTNTRLEGLSIPLVSHFKYWGNKHLLESVRYHILNVRASDVVRTSVA